MVKFRQVLLNKSKYPLKSPYPMDAKYITVHNTWNDAPAINEINYMINNNTVVGFHVAVDDVEIIQAIPFDRMAYHAGDGGGDGNMRSIGIEICYSRSGGTRYKKAELNAIQYIASLLRERGWGVDRVKQHYDWSKKNCPHRIRDSGRWDDFILAIENELRGVEDEVKLTDTGKTAVKNIIKKARDKGLISTTHTDAKIEQYDDGQLINYGFASLDKLFK